MRQAMTVVRQILGSIMGTAALILVLGVVATLVPVH
jgi:hypothetical protein